jgi:hypothetical protein
MARYWLSQKYDLSADDLVALLRSNEGLKILEAVMGDARPLWWKHFTRRQRRGQLRSELKELQKQLDLLDEENS